MSLHASRQKSQANKEEGNKFKRFFVIKIFFKFKKYANYNKMFKNFSIFSLNPQTDRHSFTTRIFPVFVGA
jgi:hypothetical protein